MAEITTEEAWHTTADGEKLYTKTWKPSGEIKARMVLVHGFSDHCNAYGPLFPLLAGRGIEVFAWDQRGWGRSVKSPVQRGLSGPTARVLSDIASILECFVPKSVGEKTDLPLFLAGHSMGGAEVLLFATSPLYASINSHISGYLALSPYIRLHESTAPSRLTVIAGRLASKVLPKLHMHNPLDAAFLSPDQAVIQQFKDDELCHDTGTLEGLAGMLDRAAEVDRKGAVKLADGPGEAGTKRIYVCHGTDDRICDFKGTERWVKEDCDVKDKTWVAYQGWRHRINDQEGDKKQIFAMAVADWVLQRT